MNREIEIITRIFQDPHTRWIFLRTFHETLIESMKLCYSKILTFDSSLSMRCLTSARTLSSLRSFPVPNLSFVCPSSVRSFYSVYSLSLICPLSVPPPSFSVLPSLSLIFLLSFPLPFSNHFSTEKKLLPEDFFYEDERKQRKDNSASDFLISAG